MSESLTFQDLLKNRKLLPAEKLEKSWLFTKKLKQSYYHLHQQTVLLKIIYIMTLGLKLVLWLNGKLFDFKQI